MAVTISTTFKGSGIGAGRVGIREWIRINSDQDTAAMGLVNKLSTSQEFENFKQITDFGYPQETAEGAASYLDNKVTLYQESVTPVEYTLMFGLTKKAQFTDQYGLLAEYKGDIKDAFVDLRSLAVMNLYNNGFTSSYSGIDGVELFDTAHPYQSYPTWSNRGNSSGTDMALSYDNVGVGLTQMRTVKTARQRPMRMRTGVRLIVPPALEFRAMAIANSSGRYDSANREDNQLSSRISVEVHEDLSSTTAWFMQDKDTSKLGLFFLQQMPFDIMEGAWDPKTRTQYVSCFESFAVKWKHAHRTWGTTGA